MPFVSFLFTALTIGFSPTWGISPPLEEAIVKINEFIMTGGVTDTQTAHQSVNTSVYYNPLTKGGGVSSDYAEHHTDEHRNKLACFEAGSMVMHLQNGKIEHGIVRARLLQMIVDNDLIIESWADHYADDGYSASVSVGLGGQSSSSQPHKGSFAEECRN